MGCDYLLGVEAYDVKNTNTYGRRPRVSSWHLSGLACDLCKLRFMGTLSCPQEDSNH